MAAAVLVAVGGVVAPFLTGVLAVQIKGDRRIDDVVFGAGLTAFYGVEGVGAVLAGRHIDRIGWRRGILVAAAISACSLLAIAALAVYPTLFVGLLAVAGLAQAAAGPASNLTIARAIHPDRHGVVIGALRSAIPLATLFAGISVPLIALRVGWRATFAVAAVFPLLAALAVPRGTSDRVPPPATKGPPPTRVLSPPFILVVAGAGLATVANPTSP